MSATKNASVNVRIQKDIKKQAEQILETIGVPTATAIDMFYRQIILNNGIPFSLTIPNNVPVRENMNDNDFNLIMRTGYMQAVEGKSKDVDEVFDILEKGIWCGNTEFTLLSKQRDIFLLLKTIT